MNDESDYTSLDNILKFNMDDVKNNKDNEIPNLGKNVVVVDYEQERAILLEEAGNEFDEYAKVYLDEKFLEHPIVIRKREKICLQIARLEQMAKSTERSLQKLLSDIDNGRYTIDTFGVQTMLQKEIRENIKQSYQQMYEVESFFKNIKEELERNVTALNLKNKEGEAVSPDNKLVVKGSGMLAKMVKDLNIDVTELSSNMNLGKTDLQKKNQTNNNPMDDF